MPLAATDSPLRRELAAVCAGGVLGTLLRALLADRWPVAPGTWPWATFAANLAGAAILGYAAVRLHARPSAERRFVGTGFCGALTTFSTMQVELLDMLDGHDYGLAAGYLATSVALGLLAVAGGARLGRSP